MQKWQERAADDQHHADVAEGRGLQFDLLIVDQMRHVPPLHSPRHAALSRPQRPLPFRAASAWRSASAT
jgi:hypothetical protein